MSEIMMNNLKAAIYCRKSQESEERQVLSLPAQLDEATKVAQQYGISRYTAFEEAKSAKTTGKRVVFADMVRHIQRGRIDAIICWKLDRLARNMVEGGIIIDLLQKGALKAIITPFKVYYPTENALLLAVEFGSANQYSRDLSTNVKRGQTKRANMGYPHGIAPNGFLNDKASKQMIPDTERLPIIKELFNKYLNKAYSGHQLYYWARNEAKLTTPTRKKCGNKLVSRSLIYLILRNPFYAGFFFLQDKRFETARELPRIITELEHYKILRNLNKNTQIKTQLYQTLFYGVIKAPGGEFVGPDIKMQVICQCKKKFAYLNKTRCPDCHTKIEDIKNPTYLRYVYYRNNVLKKHSGHAKYLPEAIVKEQFLNYIKNNLSFHQNFSQWCIKNMCELEERDNAGLKEENERKKKRINELISKKSKFRNLLAEGAISLSEYNDDIGNIEIELETIAMSPGKKDYYEMVERLFNLGRDVENVIENKKSKFEDCRARVLEIGANLEWDEKMLVIQCSKLFQTLIDELNLFKANNEGFEPRFCLAEQDQTGEFERIRPSLLATLDTVRKNLPANGTLSAITGLLNYKTTP